MLVRNNPGRIALLAASALVLLVVGGVSLLLLRADPSREVEAVAAVVQAPADEALPEPVLDPGAAVEPVAQPEKEHAAPPPPADDRAAALAEFEAKLPERERNALVKTGQAVEDYFDYRQREQSIAAILKQLRAYRLHLTRVDDLMKLGIDANVATPPGLSADTRAQARAILERFKKELAEMHAETWERWKPPSEGDRSPIFSVRLEYQDAMVRAWQEVDRRLHEVDPESELQGLLGPPRKSSIYLATENFRFGGQALQAWWSGV